MRVRRSAWHRRWRGGTHDRIFKCSYDNKQDPHVASTGSRIASVGESFATGVLPPSEIAVAICSAYRHWNCATIHI